MFEINWLDIVIFSIIMISTAISIFRGFCKEVISLFTWITSGLLAFYFGSSAGKMLVVIETESIRTLIGSAIVFIVCLLLGSICGIALNKLIRLGVIDRIMGFFFGMARGLAVVAVMVLVLMSTAIVEHELWQNSVLVPKVAAGSKVAMQYLPLSIKDKLQDNFTLII